jgi:tripartite-type tricarboxylate transporter receptor subunit TctC
LNVASWVALFAPPGTPPDIVAKMSDAVVGFAAAQDFRSRLEATGQEATPIPHAEFVNYMNSEWAKWDGVVKAARIEAK